MNLLDRWLGKEHRAELPKNWSGGGFSRVREAMDNVVDRIRRATEREHWTGPQSQRAGFPAVDIAEDEKAVRVRIDLPGVRPEELRMDFGEQTLAISGSRRDEWLEEGLSPRTRERASGGFQRSIRLPAKVVSSRAERSFQNGVMVVALPKASAEQSVRVPIGD